MTFCPKGLNSWAKPPTALPRSLQPPWAKAGPAAAIINAMSSTTVTNMMRRLIAPPLFLLGLELNIDKRANGSLRASAERGERGAEIQRVTAPGEGGTSQAGSLRGH